MYMNFFSEISLRFKISEKPVGHWWLMPIIVATWDAEIRRIMVQSQPRLKTKKARSYLKNSQHENGWWSGLSGSVPARECEVLSSNPSITRQKLKKTKGR
jgi:hypothetical protein